MANHLSKTREIDDAEAFLCKVANRITAGEVLFTSDKLKAYPGALLLVFGVPERPDEKPRGRPRKRQRRVFPEGLLYGQIDKERERGRLVCIDRRAVFGTHAQIQAVLDRDGKRGMINTSIVERDNLSFRQHNGRTVRKTLSFSKNWQMHQASVDFEDAVHNFVRPHSSLKLRIVGPKGRRKWVERTPAMAAGLTDRIWSLRELLSYRPPSRE